MAFPLSVFLPFDHVQYGNEFVSMDAVRRISKAAEDAGFTAGAVTDHPAPSYRWLDNGGHYAQDPFVMLGMVAAVTSRLRLQTDIIVLAYRNPFITARSVSSLDAFSNGRVILGMGAGYLKPEFKALGVDFDNRNDLMDEYIRAMKLAWTGGDFSFEGTGYTAVGNRMLPAPVQKPCPPLLIGGNSKRALRRTVELADAWHPFIMPKAVTDTARTRNIEGADDLVAAMDYMREHSEKVGRAVPPQVICSGTFTVAPGFDAQEAIDHYGELKKIGIAGSGASIDADNASLWCDLALEFGEKVISRLD